jgi:hypothetical protein
VQVSPELCLSETENPFVVKLVEELNAIDKGISLAKNFKDFGAQDAHFINMDELVVSKF